MNKMSVFYYPISLLYNLEPLFYQRKSVHVFSSLETIFFILKDSLSVSRFGDGVLKIMHGGNIAFQIYDKLLAVRLKELIKSNLDKHLVCIPRYLVDMNNITSDVKTFWKYSLMRNRALWNAFLNEEKFYGDALFTRFYMDLADKRISTLIIEKVKDIWCNKNIVIIEGRESRLGVGNDLFSGAMSIRRIICPTENAYSCFDKILSVAQKYDKNYLFLIALGPTATLLAYDLCLAGYQALDIGHIDIEYEWYLRNANKKIPITGKYVNECLSRGGDIADINYESQIDVVI